MATYGEPIELSESQHSHSPKNGVQTMYKNSDTINTGDGSNTKGLASLLRVRKLFSGTQIFAFSLTYMCSWEVLCSQMMFALYNGGPQVLAWGTLIAYVGALAQAASIAEMASSVPIAGAQYHWTNVLAPPNAKKFMTWLQGWMTWFGWVSVLGVYVQTAALVIQAMASVQDPTYIAERWHTSVIMIALMLLYATINSFRWAFVMVPWLELVAGILHVALFILFIVVLLVMGTQNSASYIFTHQEILSGWDTNPIISWHLGLLTCVGSFISLDGTVHMAEETRMAKKMVPRAVFYGILTNGALGFVMVVCVLRAMGSFDEELAFAPYPMAVVLLRVTKSESAATAMLCGILIILICSGLGGVASVSRLTWAWARDGGLPRWFAIVDAKHLLPVRAVWLALSINCVLALLNVASTAAYGAILSLATLALFVSYGIAFLTMLIARYRSHKGLANLELGEWNMGGFGVYVNSFALLYTAYMSVFLPIPYFLPVTAVTMNYSGPIFAVVLLFIISSWYVWGRRKWPGVNNEIVEFVKEHADGNTSGSRVA